MLHRQSADQVGVVLALAQLGFIHLCAGELEAAADRYSGCARLAEGSGNTWYETYGRWGLGVVAWLRGDPGRPAGEGGAARRPPGGMDDSTRVALVLGPL